MSTIGQSTGDSGQTKATTATDQTPPDTTSSVSNATTLQTLLTSLAAISANASSSSSGSTSESETTPSEGNEATSGTGLSESQVVQETSKDPSDQGKGGGPGGGSGGGPGPISESGQTQLAGPKALDTSNTSNTAANIEKQAAALMGKTFKEVADSSPYQPVLNTTKFANNMSQLAPNFIASATTLGLKPNDISNICPHLENVTNLANTLNTISNAGASFNATHGVMNQIQKEFTLACAGIAVAFANTPSALASLLVTYKGASPEAATATANGFSNLITNYNSLSDFLTGNPKSGSDSTSTTTALDSSSYQTTEMAVGDFACNAALGLSYLDSYESFVDTTNANIGNYSATISTAVNANTQKEVKTEIHQMNEAKQAAKVGGIMGKCFSPFKTLSKIVTPMVISVESSAIAWAVNTASASCGGPSHVVSKSQVSDILNKTTMSAIQGDLKSVMKPVETALNTPTVFITKELVDGLAKAIPGLDKSLLTTIITPFVAYLLCDPILMFQGGQKLDDLITNSVVQGLVEALAKAFPGINTTLAKEILTPLVASMLCNPILMVQSGNKLATIAIVDLCMAINPNLNKDLVEEATSEAIVGAEMIAVNIALMCCGGEEAAPEVDAAMDASVDSTSDAAIEQEASAGSRQTLMGGTTEANSAFSDALAARGKNFVVGSAEASSSGAFSGTDSAEAASQSAENNAAQESERLGLSEGDGGAGDSAKADAIEAHPNQAPKDSPSSSENTQNATTASKNSSMQDSKNSAKTKEEGGDVEGAGSGAMSTSMSTSMSNFISETASTLTKALSKLSEAGDKLLNSTTMSRVMKTQALFSALSTMAQSGITIWENVIQTEIAATQYAIAQSQAIQTNLDYSMSATNANTSNTSQAINANITGISTGNAAVSNSAATTTMDFPV